MNAPAEAGNVQVDSFGAIVHRLEVDVERCLDALSHRLIVAFADTGTHRLLTITGVDCSAECLRDLAVYCVGQIAKAVQVNLQVKADLLGFDNRDAREQLIPDVYSVIGENNNALTAERKTDERDPWLFEALSHLFVHLSVRNAGFLPVGRLIGLIPTHKSVKEQGLDLLAVYAGDAVGFGIGECKARENDPSGGLLEAVRKFSDIDSGGYNSDLRSTAGMMRESMPLEYRDQMTGAFWREERAYMPFIGYSSSHHPRWACDRQTLMCLGVPATHRLLFPMPLENFRDFFDRLADEMRAYLSSLEQL
jgi:hypothetical protein